ncbi:Phosphate carrier protein, mitochondrial [Dirofilaria immitis]|nr:Phosphate carrier protein, mitochondrial [Dirofilaria immitis]
MFDCEVYVTLSCHSNFLCVRVFRCLDRLQLAGKSTEEVEFGSFKYFILCGLGGVISCGTTHTAIVPLDLVKCRIQVNPEKYKGIIQGFRTTGWAPTLVGYSLQGLGKFGFTRCLKFSIVTCSARIFADMLLAPMEATKVRVQTSPGAPPTLRDCAPMMYRNEGIMSFYKGLPPLWMRQIPYTMMKFACFERTLEALYRYVVPKPRSQCTKQEQLVVTFVAGYIAGVFCAVVSHPADTIVSKLNQDSGSSASAIVKNWASWWFIYDSVKVYFKLPRPPPPEMPLSLRKNWKQPENYRTYLAEFKSCTVFSRQPYRKPITLFVQIWVLGPADYFFDCLGECDALYPIRKLPHECVVFFASHGLGHAIMKWKHRRFDNCRQLALYYSLILMGIYIMLPSSGKVVQPLFGLCFAHLYLSETRRNILRLWEELTKNRIIELCFFSMGNDLVKRWKLSDDSWEIPDAIFARASYGSLDRGGGHWHFERVTLKICTTIPILSYIKCERPILLTFLGRRIFADISLASMEPSEAECKQY